MAAEEARAAIGAASLSAATSVLPGDRGRPRPRLRRNRASRSIGRALAWRSRDSPCGLTPENIGQIGPELERIGPRALRDLLRAPDPRPWEERRGTEALEGRAGAGRARRPGRVRLRLGGRAPLPRGVLALDGAGGLPRRGEPADEAHPARATASCRSRRRSTTRPGSRSGSRRSTWSRTGGSTSAPVSRRSAAELGGFGDRPGREAREVGGRDRRDRPDVRGGAVRRLDGEYLRCRRATSSRSRSRSRTRRCGSRAAGARRSSSPRARASARCRSRSSSPRRRASGSRSTTS